mmetsp:Transcript_124095/g.347511  ORF Transcript_124095/g.347511 Transcript_124095/m.347511 type:complete len:237 (-) Transcript_124095:325-1035(-)
MQRRGLQPRRAARHRYRGAGPAGRRARAVVARAIRCRGVARPAQGARGRGGAAPAREPRGEEGLGRDALGASRVHRGGARRPRRLGVEAQVRLPHRAPARAALSGRRMGGRRRSGRVGGGVAERGRAVPRRVRQVCGRGGPAARPRRAPLEHHGRLASSASAARSPRARELPHPARPASSWRVGRGGRDGGAFGPPGHGAVTRPQPIRQICAQGLVADPRSFADGPAHLEINDRRA